MKVFWALVGLLAVVTAGLFLMPGGASEPQVVAPVRGVSEHGAAVPVEADAGAVEATPTALPGPAPTAPAAVDPVTPARDEAVVAVDAPVQAGAAAEAPEPAEVEAPGVGTTPAVTLSAQAQAWLEQTFGAGPGAAKPADEAVVVEPEAAEASADPNASGDVAAGAAGLVEAGVLGAGAEGAAGSAGVVAGEVVGPAPRLAAPAPAVAVDHVERRDDGTLLVGGRWVIKGDGSAASPYEVDWKVLQSAQSVYQPQQGRDRLPSWAEALNGKRVRVSGYTMLPMGGEAQDQMLVMLNQWDGCCIGVPPSPYDAAEVTLSRPLAPSAGALGHQGASLYGDVVGTLRIDPYIVRGWLLGLYVIEDGVFTPLGG